MERINQNIIFLENELALERDQYRRNLILEMLQRQKQDLLDLMREENRQQQQVQDNLRTALEMAKAREAEKEARRRRDEDGAI